MSIYELINNGRDGSSFDVYIDGKPHECVWVSIDLELFELAEPINVLNTDQRVLLYASQAADFTCAPSGQRLRIA